jgi:hypothetical protein
MVLKDIISISGEAGLFKFVAHGKNSIIVEHLETKKRSSAFGSAKVNNLDDIAIFTEKEEMPLSQVFNLIFDNSACQQVIDSKVDGVQLKKWFESVLPDYDKNRVYVSDIKKVAQWYNTLQKLDLLVREEPEEKQDTAEEHIAEQQEETQEEKPAKKKKTPPTQNKAK